ncbi:MAG: PAS domain S-box protein [Firmicutes bacterium]|nr:PAS domain S-box protein [Bacillota bacterium]
MDNLLYKAFMPQDIQLHKQDDTLPQAFQTCRTIITTLGIAVVVFDDEMNISLINEEMECLLGLTHEIVAEKKTLIDFIVPAEQSHFLTFYEQQKQSEKNPLDRRTFTLLDNEQVRKQVSITIRMLPQLHRAVATIMDVTDDVSIHLELQESEHKFRLLFENAQEGIYQTTPSGTIILANPAFVAMLGYSSLEEVLALNIEKDIYINNEQRNTILNELTSTGKVSNYQLNWQKKDGSIINIVASSHIVRDAQGEIIFYENTAVDITKAKEAQRALESSHQFFRNIVQYLPDPTFAVDTQGIIVAWNNAVETLTGFSAHDMLGKGNYEYALPFYGERRPLIVDYLLTGTLPPHDQYSNLSRDGETVTSEAYSPLLRAGEGAYLWGSASLIRDGEGKAIGAINTIKDFTDYKETQKKLQYYSMNDILTGLYNRSYFEEEMKRLNHSRFLPLSVITCDVDGLKLINDSLGHPKGDELLQAAATVLRSSFRAWDAISRIGGDEFAVILPNTDSETAQKIVRRLADELDSYNKSNPAYHLSLSIGFATGTLPLQEVFIEADNSLLRNKMYQSGNAKHHFTKALLVLLSERDFINEGHGERLESLAIAMADAINLSTMEKEQLIMLAKFHDIGKVGISDRILFKPSTLTKEEMQEMKRHAEIGYRIAQSSPEISHIANYILHHHEWWNGQGYPFGLRGEDIPKLSRILAIIDAYDAMSNHRPHRKALTQQEVIHQLTLSSGKQFDPYLLRYFFEIIQKQETITRKENE